MTLPPTVNAQMKLTRRRFMQSSSLLTSGGLLTSSPLIRAQGVRPRRILGTCNSRCDRGFAKSISCTRGPLRTEKLVVETIGSGCAWMDYDQDGFLDALFVNSGRTPNFNPAIFPQPALYRNNGDGTFTDVTVKSGLHLADGFYIGAAVGDYNNDGFPDIYMTGYGRSVLFRNNGNGTFTDITASAGVANEGRWATAAAWFDYDHDGRLDLLVTNYVNYDWNHDPYCGVKEPGYRFYCDPFHFHGTSMRLFHNNGDGTFTDRTEKAGLLNSRRKEPGRGGCGL